MIHLKHHNDSSPKLWELLPAHAEYAWAGSSLEKIIHGPQLVIIIICQHFTSLVTTCSFTSLMTTCSFTLLMTTCRSFQAEGRIPHQLQMTVFLKNKSFIFDYFNTLLFYILKNLYSFASIQYAKKKNLFLYLLKNRVVLTFNIYCINHSTTPLRLSPRTITLKQRIQLNFWLAITLIKHLATCISCSVFYFVWQGLQATLRLMEAI